MEGNVLEVARLADTLPFRRLVEEVLGRTGLAREAGLPVTTARKYLDHLQLTGMVFPVHAFPHTLTGKVVRTPRLWWCDLGLRLDLAVHSPGPGEDEGRVRRNLGASRAGGPISNRKKTSVPPNTCIL